VEWFKIYKIPDGKPLNEFAFDGKPKVILKHMVCPQTKKCYRPGIRIKPYVDYPDLES
jgi:hypothetical protein